MKVDTTEREQQLARMLEGGPFGALVSMLCLGAAMALQRGTPTDEIVVEAGEIAGHVLTDDDRQMLRRVMAQTYEELGDASPEELQAAIDLYRDHLRLAGIKVSEGYGAH